MQVEYENHWKQFQLKEILNLKVDVDTAVYFQNWQFTLPSRTLEIVFTYGFCHEHDEKSDPWHQWRFLSTLWEFLKMLIGDYVCVSFLINGGPQTGVGSYANETAITDAVPDDKETIVCLLPPRSSFKATFLEIETEAISYMTY